MVDIIMASSFAAFIGAIALFIIVGSYCMLRESRK